MEYEALIEDGHLPIKKGIAVDADDLLRADVIQALMCYDRAIMLKADYTNAWYNKGVLLGSKGNLTEAKECFDKVLEIEPSHALAIKHKKIIEDLVSRRQSTIVRVRKVKPKDE